MRRQRRSDASPVVLAGGAAGDTASRAAREAEGRRSARGVPHRADAVQEHPEKHLSELLARVAELGALGWRVVSVDLDASPVILAGGAAEHTAAGPAGARDVDSAHGCGTGLGQARAPSARSGEDDPHGGSWQAAAQGPGDGREAASGSPMSRLKTMARPEGSRTRSANLPDRGRGGVGRGTRGLRRRTGKMPPDGRFAIGASACGRVRALEIARRRMAADPLPVGRSDDRTRTGLSGRVAS